VFSFCVRGRMLLCAWKKDQHFANTNVSRVAFGFGNSHS
jgi:hypothetical protein